VCVVPTQYMRGVAQRFEDALAGDVAIVSATKGIEIETFKTPSQILLEVLGERPVCVLTGPSHAEEVAGRQAVLGRRREHGRASRAPRAGRVPLEHVPRVHARRSARRGARGRVEERDRDRGGNQRRARARRQRQGRVVDARMVEIARFGRSRGAQPETFFGLAGIGDLVTTCCSRHSRNRAVAKRSDGDRSSRQCSPARRWSRKACGTAKALFGPEADLGDLAMPICEQVHAVLFDGKDPREAVLDLMSRAPVGEMHGLSEGFG
jgi:glycerol-3-phosphate dehydrogenase (NAD(P)+)